MATTFDSLVREVRAILRGYGLVKEQVTFLNGAVTNSALTFKVDEGTSVIPGVVEIDDESIYVRSVSSNTATVAPDGRGWDSTTAATHADGARVTIDPTYPAWRIENAVNDAIAGTYPTLHGVGTTSFIYNAAENTYSLPADATGIIKVIATVPGPTHEQPEIHEFRVDLNANTTQFPTGKCITLLKVPFVGQTVTILYRKRPSLLNPGDLLTASGLQDTARPCIVYGALGRILSVIDAGGIADDTALASELNGVNKAGTATTLSAQLTARYQMELDAEQARQRQLYPPKVRWIGR